MNRNHTTKISEGKLFSLNTHKIDEQPSQKEHRHSDERRERRHSYDRKEYKDNHHSSSSPRKDETDSRSKDWSQRAGKNPRLQEYLQREDEEIIREHLEQMDKKQSKT